MITGTILVLDSFRTHVDYAAENDDEWEDEQEMVDVWEIIDSIICDSRRIMSFKVLKREECGSREKNDENHQERMKILQSETEDEVDQKNDRDFIASSRLLYRDPEPFALLGSSCEDTAAEQILKTRRKQIPVVWGLVRVDQLLIPEERRRDHQARKNFGLCRQMPANFIPSLVFLLIMSMNFIPGSASWSTLSHKRVFLSAFLIIDQNLIPEDDDPPGPDQHQVIESMNHCTPSTFSLPLFTATKYLLWGFRSENNGSGERISFPRRWKMKKNKKMKKIGTPGFQIKWLDGSPNIKSVAILSFHFESRKGEKNGLLYLLQEWRGGRITWNKITFAATDIPFCCK